MLSNEVISKVSELILRGLVEKRLITLKAQREKVKNSIKNAILKELKKEKALDKEVDALIEKNRKLVEGDSFDYDMMFNMVKVKLAKEKGIVL